MSEYLLLVLAGIVVFVLVILVWLLRQQQTLKKQFQLLEERVQRSNEDVAGLCSAAVAVDRRLAANDSRLNSIVDQVNTQRQTVTSVTPVEPIPASGYEDVIQKIRSGVGIEELVRDCGLTRDEAVLLMRLHGGGKRSGLG
ncbi:MULTISPECIES: DUF2802 domain-containing protein [Methylomonas]|uniref:DUF2802 domain-containing protein n=2 Tax=Methylomonas TaxID=416 RepID=A0A126T5K1_9GAMM|nr:MULTISPECIES: DUF2802 domain-containing protein [Methylomonas]AMK77348.1 hypothetical protein JT25_012810 [Methylomonas denitrificans]OAI08817.1 hypothetical protein A1342_20440 [Methylomonas methanica]TCV75695.1 uncharacterized protein DUF2802 [Methylomonas methanica]